MVKKIEIQELPLWDKLGKALTPISFELELTARCNLNCRHCYINLPASDNLARSKELSLKEIENIADQAADLGTLWCVITGGEPLLRPDFKEIYMLLKKKGFLLTIFTNASLINEDHIELFNNYPPRDIEITVYGLTQETYEAVTLVKGSFKAYRRGLELLISNDIGVTLKAMALRSNLHEIDAITKFCKENTKLPFRFDPFLHLRYDFNPLRNEEIKQERLSPKEIVSLEMFDESRFQSMQNNCDNLIFKEKFSYEDYISNPDRIDNEAWKEFRKLFRCGIGNGGFTVSYDGQLCLCSTLRASGLTFDLRKGLLEEGLRTLRSKIRSIETKSTELLKTCKSCKIVNLCMWCPAIAFLETGDMEGEAQIFCQVAHARAEALHNSLQTHS